MGDSIIGIHESFSLELQAVKDEQITSLFKAVVARIEMDKHPLWDKQESSFRFFKGASIVPFEIA